MVGHGLAARRGRPGRRHRRHPAGRAAPHRERRSVTTRSRSWWRWPRSATAARPPSAPPSRSRETRSGSVVRCRSTRPPSRPARPWSARTQRPGWCRCGSGRRTNGSRWRPDRRQLPDVGEADRGLRAALLESAELLARLDVARWRPEVADELLNLRRVSALEAPPGVPPRCVDLAARGLQALGIADAGAGGRRRCADRRRGRGPARLAIVPLDRAGRRALTAACSPEVWPPA